MAIAFSANGRSAARYSRWSVANASLAFLFLYLALIARATQPAAVWINDLTWTIASLFSCLVAARTARRLPRPAHKAWAWIAAGCGSWFVGQLHWNYHELVLGQAMPYPNVGQLFYSAFPVCVIAGVLQFPEARDGSPLTPKRLGNVALVVCCLIASGLLGLVEPVRQSQASTAFLFAGAVQSLLVASTFLVALFALWSYQWSRTWAAMLLIVIATGVYSITNLIYSYALLTDSYVVSGVINASWVAVFGLIAWAAHERLWLEEHPGVEAPHHMLARERWLEAVVPALLIAIIVAVALAVPANVSARALGYAAVVLILFAVILGIREAWIQRETQRLNDALSDANRQLEIANADLLGSEQRYRELNARLETRVQQRTKELSRAYGELEGFSYAVAHDLKAPLRSINSFAQLLREHLGAESDPNGYLERVRSGALKMAALIDDLLAYAHMERRHLHMTGVDVSAVIAAVLDECADEIRARSVTVRFNASPLTISVDVDGLMLVLRNLIGNALKYSRGVAAPMLRIQAAQRGDVVLIEVTDNGIGFDMKHHDQIFRIFQRLHRDSEFPGTGIGLALVRKAVQRMRGRVWAESEPTRGARFYVELPLNPLLATDPAVS